MKKKKGFPEEGRLVVSGILEPLNYTYDIFKNNTNGRTIQRLSLESQSTTSCDDDDDSCPFRDYDKFYKYYDHFEYADEWITSAFDGKETTQLERGSANFGIMGENGRNGRFPKKTKKDFFFKLLTAKGRGKIFYVTTISPFRLFVIILLLLICRITVKKKTWFPRGGG